MLGLCETCANFPCPYISILFYTLDTLQYEALSRQMRQQNIEASLVLDIQKCPHYKMEGGES